MHKTEKTQIFTKTGRIKKQYECVCCDFNTSNKTDYFRHLKTKKHLKNKKNEQKTENLETQKNVCSPSELKPQNLGITFCICQRQFKTKSGMWKHKQKCEMWQSYTESKVSKKVSKKRQKISIVSKAPNSIDINSVDEELKQLQLQKAKLEVMKLKQEIKNLENPNFVKNNQNVLTNELVETIGKIAGDNNCNNTNNISINMYLNKNCKNAMNLEDFVQNIRVSLQDLDFSAQNGYAKGIANIFMKQLQDLAPTERPIHCSDKKRLQFYVKDDNKWAKDKNNEKIKKSIKDVKLQQVKQMNEWEKNNPDYQKDPKKLQEWQNMLENVSGGVNDAEKNKNDTKIQKELGKIVDIKEELQNS